jgi:hypothetical protein
VSPFSNALPCVSKSELSSATPRGCVAIDRCALLNASPSNCGKSLPVLSLRDGCGIAFFFFQKKKKKSFPTARKMKKGRE